MFDCVNLDCPRVSKMLRCGLCRRRKDYICAACGISVNTNIKIYCEECAKFSKLEWAKEYQTTYRCKHRIRIRIQQNRCNLKRKELNKSKEIIIHG